jgi:transcriptional regulator with XRE-family HTH domain
MATGKDLKHTIMADLPAHLLEVGPAGADWNHLDSWAHDRWADRWGTTGIRTMLKSALRALKTEGVLRTWEVTNPAPGEQGVRWALTYQPRRLSGREVRSRRLDLPGSVAQDKLAGLLGVSQNLVSKWEAGARPVPYRIETELRGIETSMEADVEAMTVSLVDAVKAHPGTPIAAWGTNEEFWAAHPDSDGLPVDLQQVAAARAQKRLRDMGIDVAIVGAVAEGEEDWNPAP